LGNKEGGQGLKGEGQRSGIQGNWEYLSQKGFFFLFLATKVEDFFVCNFQVFNQEKHWSRCKEISFGLRV
jgi:hypothetical protein